MNYRLTNTMHQKPSWEVNIQSGSKENKLYVIGCKNIHTVLLKLYNQFYMNILYEIVRKNVHTFMKKNIWILLANFC